MRIETIVPSMADLRKQIRNCTIEEIVVRLKESYPDHLSTNAFCAAIRSMKSS